MVKRVDDVILRASAANFVRQLMVEHPVIALAQHAIDGSERCAFVVEVRVGAAGPERPTLLLDLCDAQRQQVLWPRPVYDTLTVPRGRPAQAAVAARNAVTADLGADTSDCDPASRRSTRRLRPGPQR
jgi:hypothetical protein